MRSVLNINLFIYFSQKRYPRLYPFHVTLDKRLEMDHSCAVNDSVFLNESLKWTNRAAGSLQVHFHALNQMFGSFG